MNFAFWIKCIIGVLLAKKWCVLFQSMLGVKAATPSWT